MQVAVSGLSIELAFPAEQGDNQLELTRSRLHRINELLSVGDAYIDGIEDITDDNIKENFDFAEMGESNANADIQSLNKELKPIGYELRLRLNKKKVAIHETTGKLVGLCDSVTGAMMEIVKRSHNNHIHQMPMASDG